MKSYVRTMAALAAMSFSGAAFAGDTTTTTRPAAMTDAEMDAVTAGEFGPGFGVVTANERSDGRYGANPIHQCCVPPFQTGGGKFTADAAPPSPNVPPDLP